MQIRDVMTRNVEVVQPIATLRETAERMRLLNVGALPVCQGDRLLGILTDRDITVRASAEGRDPREVRAIDVMTPNVVCCYEDQDIKEAALLMQEQRIRRLPVLNDARKLVGMVSLADLATGADAKLAAKTLERVSQPLEPIAR